MSGPTENTRYVLSEYAFLRSQGVPFEQIAEQLGVKPNTLTALLSRHDAKEYEDASA